MSAPNKDNAEVEVWERIYDNPKLENGSPKPNKLLGKFKKVQSILEDMYAEQWIGQDDKGNLYMVEGREVSFTNGGTRYSITKLPTLTKLISDSYSKGKVDGGIAEITTYLNRSDSLSEEKYAFRRLNHLKEQSNE